MSNVLKFKRIRASRAQALNWLAQSSHKFPSLSEQNPISADLFHGWRFVRAIDGVVYFANCIEPGITETELSSRMSA
jgi:hypothetical protein